MISPFSLRGYMLIFGVVLGVAFWTAVLRWVL
jgi:hypothetical protein